jgi:ribosomal protein L37AE/L43A
MTYKFCPVCGNAGKEQANVWKCNSCGHSHFVKSEWGRKPEEVRTEKIKLVPLVKGVKR